VSPEAPLSPDTWRRVKTIFHAVLEHPEQERAALLDAQCGADARVRAEVESLLEARERSGSFIEPPEVPSLFALAEREATHRLLGLRVGAFELIAHVGSGGMGDVFRARRVAGDFEQQVAIKLVRDRHLNDETRRRFLKERELLARLAHANIARLLDGGTTDDQVPYLVMEYVEGQPIDAYCEERRLSVRGRLELFRIVCLAVQHAHQHLIVHRDLKPKNVLVTREGEPKLLDFGIAKVLAESGDDQSIDVTRTLATDAHARVREPRAGAGRAGSPPPATSTRSA
jgi:serine/threonine protein kinase